MVHVVQNASDTVPKLLVLINERGWLFVSTKPFVGGVGDAI
jgi:hypothetical protein